MGLLGLFWGELYLYRLPVLRQLAAPETGAAN
jgi:hypothetical protein